MSDTDDPWDNPIAGVLAGNQEDWGPMREVTQEEWDALARRAFELGRAASMFADRLWQPRAAIRVHAR